MSRLLLECAAAVPTTEGAHRHTGGLEAIKSGGTQPVVNAWIQVDLPQSALNPRDPGRTKERQTSNTRASIPMRLPRPLT